ncbi:restriction endonuclease subunit S [Escherichia coli]|uniref:restriction endonuclease subunit S n=1 Tax=Escherichia coli TaxID=562 RepID=UPI000D19C62D|nr:restriction endonuclease subunit S [Escherichia coli]EFN8571139.1 restriction endonuclease subunit S [Escherichia coli O85:H32]AVT72900.1 type I restriction endonuclease subunit S [Escherichia coli]EFE1553001.1 restriction endonuclease subunit S [Escherichia coli]EFH6087495.1 restriction endonuclease subunit S [Escherichia coli]EFL9566849.1 restriction endonuclease subunit S [Escherichia coli]
MIPKGWSSQKLSSVASIIDCKHRTPEYVKSGIPLVSPGTIKWGALDLISPVKRVTEEEYRSLMDHCVVEQGDLVMSRNQSVGVVSYVDSKKPFVLGQDTVLIKAIHADWRFIYYTLQSDLVQRQIAKSAGGSTFSRINLSDIRALNIKTPAICEQDKISQILTAWDKAISVTEKLLTNSQQQKKALMQQLLTGKKRLLDENGVRFSGDWNSSKLGDLFNFKKGKGLSKSDLSESGINKCILYGELYTKYAEIAYEVISRTNSSDGQLSEPGDILLPASTTTSGIDLANATALSEGGILLGGDINILRPKVRLSSPFLAYFLTHMKKNEISSRAQGITIIHLYGGDLKSIDIVLPSTVQEQQKIATVLSAADAEISTLEKKLACLKDEKKALMQQLLTGKRRVKVDEAVAV